jgi:pSer/pThr/pTyr-binding forkhead associated (FHA) protein
MAFKPPEKRGVDPKDQGAFIVVDGSNIVILSDPITKIGRKSDNHIVIGHKYVSRHHAQIKKVGGQFVILDLDSTVGTSVNGRRVHQKVLKAGDVISVGGVPLIFGEGTPTHRIETPSHKMGHGTEPRPTEKTDIRSADQYLDFFNTEDE